MARKSFHTHTTISDGSLPPRELIEAAISFGYEILAITDHYPRPEGIDSSGWSDGFYTDEDYKELRALKEEYKDKIKILVGAEFEWYSDKVKWLVFEVKKRDYDIRLISAHQVSVDGKYFTINYNSEVYEKALEAFGGDIKRMVTSYYESIREAVKSGLFDVVAHLDVIKTLNEESKYFSEDEGWYRKQVSHTLDLIKQSGMKMEVNFQLYIRSGKEQWPSKWIIDMARGKGIELIMSTDAHFKDDLNYDVSEIEKIMS